MRFSEIARLRLEAQHISGSTFSAPEDAVLSLGALQAQDYNAARWAAGLRAPGTAEAAVERAIDRGSIVRTWPMRGTLHFVAPGFVRTLLALCAPRVVAASAGRYRELGLDDKTFGTSRELIARALEGGKSLSRSEVMDLLERARISTEGQRGYHIISHLSQTGLLCMGPARGAEQGFVLLDEWVPREKTRTREESLAEVALVYFRGHGPATLPDFARWTGLGLMEARAGLLSVGERLEHASVRGEDYWFAPIPHESAARPAQSHLLPAFDEFLIGYGDRAAALAQGMEQRVVSRNGIFYPVLVAGGRVAGTWKRTVKKGLVEIEIAPFATPGARLKRAAGEAAEAYGRFKGLPVSLSWKA
ncbi:MAG: winged helix DNA-binding domain-containing protein [Spirochaetes bacterium]|nr:MAG: winged helix DNA-binding domain-containing protein [Spirochaetota bacterium]